MHRPERLVIASKNTDKLGEIEAVLAGAGWEPSLVRDTLWPDIEETAATLEENALIKAREVVRATGLPALADDTGLEVQALGGQPGVHTARFAGPKATYSDNVQKLLKVMEGVGDRRAVFRTVVVLVSPSSSHLAAEGHLAGEIAFEPRGDGGFGYDPIFVVGSKTLAEMTTAEKNHLSHRARALRALVEKLTP